MTGTSSTPTPDYENRVKANNETRIQTTDAEDYIFEIQVPMEEVVEIKNAQRKVINRVRIPGYVLVRMDLTDASWGAVRHTPGVTGFVGNARNPVPCAWTRSSPCPGFRGRAGREGQAGQQAEPGSRGCGLRSWRVRHRQGRSLRDPSGHDLEIKPESQTLVVLVSIFERETPVTLAFNQVTKI